MHDTAYEIGRLAMEIYAAREDVRILEIGSLNVNGTLRDFAAKASEFVGVDLEAGEGVDFVVSAGEKLPFEDGSFDLVIASSVLEHDTAFWMTFIELGRMLRPGGFIYINVPSNGAVHRFPEDHWRFYPDAGHALARWAQSQHYDIQLIESFTAPRKDDIWNDFVAVFRRDGGREGLPVRRIYTEVGGYNVWIIGEEHLKLPRDATQDMELISTSQSAFVALREEIVHAENRISQIESEKQTMLDELTHRLAEERTIAQNKVSELSRDLQKAQNEHDELKRSHHVELSAAGERFEDAERKRVEAEATSQQKTSNVEWFRQVYETLLNLPYWWHLLPKNWREGRLSDRLKQKGLFDSAAYVEMYPDVANEGFNPIRHYIMHGMAEGRELTR